MASVKDISIDELRALIGEVVEEKLGELLGDPDAGLVLRPEVQKWLRRTLRRSKDSRRAVPAAEVARRFGIDW